MPHEQRIYSGGGQQVAQMAEGFYVAGGESLDEEDASYEGEEFDEEDDPNDF